MIFNLFYIVLFRLAEQFVRIQCLAASQILVDACLAANMKLFYRMFLSIRPSTSQHHRPDCFGD